MNAAIDGLNAVPLVEPEASHTGGLVLSARDPLPPLSRALMKSVRETDLTGTLEKAVALLN